MACFGAARGSFHDLRIYATAIIRSNSFFERISQMHCLAVSEAGLLRRGGSQTWRVQSKETSMGRILLESVRLLASIVPFRKRRNQSGGNIQFPGDFVGNARLGATTLTNVETT